MKKFRQSIFLTIALALQLFISITLSTEAVKLYYWDKILPGVTVEGVDIGGLSYAAATDKLQKELPWPNPESRLSLMHLEGLGSDIRYGDIRYRADYAASVTEAAQYTREAFSLTNTLQIFKIISIGCQLPLARSFDSEAFEKILQQLANRYSIPAQNARIVKQGDVVTLYQESTGRVVDIEGTIDQLQTLPLQEYKIKLKFKDVSPTKNSSDFPHDKPNKVIKTEYEEMVIVPQQQYVIDKNIPPGKKLTRQSAKPGYLLKTYEIVYENNREKERTVVDQRRVEAVTEVVAIGPIN